MTADDFIPGYKPHYEDPEEVSIVRLALGGAFAMILSCAIVGLLLPFLLVFVIPCGLILIGMMMCSLSFGELSKRKTIKIAKAHLGSFGTTELSVVESVGEAGTLVLNDWGLVYDHPGKPIVELAWNEIAMVEEPLPLFLRFTSYSNKSFELDLYSAKRFFLITASIYGKIPKRTDFDVNPLTGESNLLARLKRVTRTLDGGSFVIDVNGVHSRNDQINWDVIESVQESEVEDLSRTRSMGKTYALTVYSHGKAISMTSEGLHNGYKLAKRIFAEKIPDRIQFINEAETPRDLAMSEFEFFHLLFDTAVPMKQRKKKYIEAHYSHMLDLVDRFQLPRTHEVKQFFKNYAELMRLTGRESEAMELERRAA